LEKKETENKNEVRSERETTPDQSPSTKAKLRKVCLSIIVLSVPMLLDKIIKFKSIVFILKITVILLTDDKLRKVIFSFI